MWKIVKRIISLALSMIMLFCAMPLTEFGVQAAYYTNNQISGVKNTILSNPTTSNYVNTMMAYYLKNNDRVVERNLKKGKSVVFFFDGCSDNVFDAGFDYKTNHRTAYVAVVQLVNGVPKIVYENENSSTIPDNPRDRNLNYDKYYGVNCSDVPVVKDGIHNIIVTNHWGYAALHVADSTNNQDVDVVRCNTKTTQHSTSNSINIHKRGGDSVRLSTPTVIGSRSSTGCFNVGLASDGYAEYNNFIYTITGKKNAANSAHSDAERQKGDVGIVIVDRYMYRDTLKKIYDLQNNGDDSAKTIDLITEYTISVLKDVEIKQGINLSEWINGALTTVVTTVKNLISKKNTGFTTRSTSTAGVNFIKQSEGLCTKAYPDPAGIWTIGYGHTGGVYSGMVISEAQAEQYLRNDLKTAENAVNAFMKTHNRYITQEQFDALVSFTFNVGSGWTQKSSYNIYKYMSTGVHTDQQVKETFGSWVNAGGRKLEGLVTRRAKEAALYLYGTYDGAGGSSYGGNYTGGASGGSSTPSSSNYSVGNYKVTTSAGLNVRKGPGTNYGIVTAIPKNTTVAITQINGNWGKYSAGWICLDYALWIGNLEPVINVPAAPSLKLTGKTDIPTGESIVVTWGKAADAVCYDIYLKNSSGATCQQLLGTTGNSVAFKVNNAGSYTVTAVSRNTKYTSSVSNTVKVTVHNPSTVTFVDWNQAVLSKQTVPYGASATAPSNPSRYGWTFKRWAGTYSNVVSNQTVTAQYERNVYTVTFVDEAGEIIGQKQKVPFESAASAPNYVAPEGYTFLKWDKEFNYIQSNLTIAPVIVWANEALPVQVLSTTTAVRENTGYTVNVALRNTPSSATDGRIIVALKTDDGKLLSMTESAAFHLKAAADKTIEVFMPYDKAATIAEIYVVEKFSTAIPISAVKHMEIDQGTAWTNWSTTPNPDNAYQAESRTEYRYRTKSTTTSSNSALSGWTKYNTTSYWGDYGAWSGWTDTYIASSDSRQVETRSVISSSNYKTVYHYYRYAASEHASTGSFSQSSSCPNLYTYTFDTPLSTTTALYGHTRYQWWYNGTNWHGLYAGSPYTTQEVVSHNYKTQYRYRDRSLIYTYHYYKWSDWSIWSTAIATANDNKQVEKRTVYRYLANDPSLVEDNSGVVRTISGKVDVSLAGEQAILFIYKVDEASDFTNEYVGQTIIGTDGSYSFTFKLREEPTLKTGDFTVTLGIEGTSTAIYLNPIEAPKPVYTVTYKDWDGTVINTQTVTEGENAVIPDTIPQREGYDFICWNETGTNVRDDMVISPVYRIRTYSVVFVDWTQETVVLHTYEHGQPLVAPEMEEQDDSVIVGWDAIIDGTTTVTDNMIITAKYETKMFTVSVLDEEGNPLEQHEIPYGSKAELPTSLPNENAELLGWSTDGDLEYVVQDMTVVPIYVFSETVAVPTASISSGEYTEAQTVSLECTTEDAVIYYSVNGDDPLINGIEYTGPFVISDSVELKYAACALGKNDSDISRKLIAINDGRKIAKHIIELIGNGTETEFDSFFVEDGSTVGFTEADFVVNGYDFGGIWYGTEFSKRWNLSSDVVTESMTMCLAWSPKTYTVTFIGYDDEILDVQEVTYMDEAIAPVCDAVEGYVFAGFDCDDLTIHEDKTITARYIPEDEYVAVSLNKTNYRLLNGTTFNLTASLSNMDASSDYTLLWCSTDEDVAIVTDNGNVTGVGSGVATIYVVNVESGSVAACQVTVVANVDEEITIETGFGVDYDSANQIRGIRVQDNMVSTVRTCFANDELVFVDINGYVLEETDLVGTGTRVRLMDGSKIVDEKTVVVTGDMNGDGKINNRDASMIVRYLVDKEVASLAQLTAIDVNGDGYVNNRDASMVSRYLVGKEVI